MTEGLGYVPPEAIKDADLAEKMAYAEKTYQDKASYLKDQIQTAPAPLNEKDQRQKDIKLNKASARLASEEVQGQEDIMKTDVIEVAQGVIDVYENLPDGGYSTVLIPTREVWDRVKNQLDIQSLGADKGVKLVSSTGRAGAWYSTRAPRMFLNHFSNEYRIYNIKNQ